VSATWGIRGRSRWQFAAALGALVALTAALPAQAYGVGPTATTTAATSDPAELVNPIVGTGTGPVFPGAVGAFPGADVPFGMVQWSPDTTPDRTQGGGYDYADDRISGFSLTHLSGAGCPVFGDVPILPVTGPVPSDPAMASEPFSHRDERAAPGRYRVLLGSPAIQVRLSVTTRSGIGTFSFPSATSAEILFNVSGSANGIAASSVETLGDHEVTGAVTSGNFCGTGGNYTLHFVAEFDHPFTSHGVWSNAGLAPGDSNCQGSLTAACGAWVGFGATADRTVTMKIGVSYVSLANAASNLRAEEPGWSLQQVEAEATGRWNDALGTIDIGGGSTAARQTFYTALYHSLLDPSTFSDDDGQYMGLDGRVHRTGGRVQYANFSEWDIYRSEIPLLSMLEPRRVSDMVQSLVNDAVQNGWLPTWEVADANSGVMNGDSADPIIADAYAFGARGFDTSSAFAAMMKGATRSGLGPEGIEERQDVDPYNRQGFVQADTYGLTSGVTIGGSATLEYAIDDFSVAQIARALGHISAYTTMMRRAQDWQNEFNPATGYIQARGTDGSFPGGPALQVYNAVLQNAGVTQEGFQEGNAIQYTWSVPQNLGDLFALMGGSSAATSSLDQFFTQLNAGPFPPYDWAGNEPDLFVPWEFDYSGAPWRTQEVVRQVADSLYSTTPAGEPGNDDLGAMSSWYVWAALGLYPLTPGSANLALASPMFPDAAIHLRSGKLLTLRAKGTPSVYVHAATVASGSGTPTALVRPWLPATVVSTGGTVELTLGPRPDQAWGAGPTAAPPSFPDGAAPAVGFTMPSGEVQARPGTVTTLTLGVQSDQRRRQSVAWRAIASPGVSVTPTSGRLLLSASRPGTGFARTTTTVAVDVDSGTPGVVRVVLSAPAALPPIVLDVNPAP